MTTKNRDLLVSVAVLLIPPCGVLFDFYIKYCILFSKGKRFSPVISAREMTCIPVSEEARDLKIMTPISLESLMQIHHNTHGEIQREMQTHPPSSIVLLKALPLAPNSGMRDLILEALEQKQAGDFKDETVLGEAYHQCVNSGMDPTVANRILVLNRRLFISPQCSLEQLP